MLKEEKITKLMEAKKNWQQKKDVAFNSFLYEQDRIKKEIEKLQRELQEHQDKWQEEKQGFDNILATYDADLMNQGFIKDDPVQQEYHHDDSDK